MSLIISNLEILFNLSIVTEIKIITIKNISTWEKYASIYLAKHQQEFIKFGQSLLDGEILAAHRQANQNLNIYNQWVYNEKYKIN